MDWAARLTRTLRTPTAEQTLKRLEQGDATLTEVALANQVTQEQLRGVCRALEKSTVVTAVRISKVHLTESSICRVVDAVRALPLTTLCLDHVGLQNNTLHLIVDKLVALPALDRLSLCGNDISRTAPLRKLLTAGTCKLKRLFLDGNKIGMHDDGDSAQLARCLAGNTTLRTLTLADNQLDGTFTAALSEVLFESNFTICKAVLKGNPQLTRGEIESVEMHLDKNRHEGGGAADDSPRASDGASAAAPPTPRQIAGSFSSAASAGVGAVVGMLRRGSVKDVGPADTGANANANGSFPVVGGGAGGSRNNSPSSAVADLQPQRRAGGLNVDAPAGTARVEQLTAEIEELRGLLAEETKLNRQQEVDYDRNTEILRDKLADATARHDNQTAVLREEIASLRAQLQTPDPARHLPTVTRMLASEHGRLQQHAAVAAAAAVPSPAATQHVMAATEGEDDSAFDPATITTTKVLGGGGGGAGKARGSRRRGGSKPPSADAHAALTAAEEAAAALRDQLAAQGRELAAAQEGEAALQAANEALTREVARVMDESTRHRTDAAALRERVGELELDAAAMAAPESPSPPQPSTDVQAQLDAEMARAAGLEERVRELEAELAAAAASLAEQQQQDAAADDVDASASAAAGLSLARLQSDLSVKSEQLADLKAEATLAAEAFGSAHAKLETEVADLNAAHAEQAARMERAHAQEVAELKESIAMLKDAVEARGAAVDAARAAKAALEGEVAGMREACSAAEAEVADVLTRLAAAEGAGEEARARAEANNETARVAAAALEEARARLAVLEADAAGGAELRAAAEGRTAELEDVCTRLAGVEGELAAAQAAHAEAAKDLDAQVVELRSTNEALTLDLEAATEDAAATKAALTKELEEVKASLQQAESEKTSVNVDHRKLQKDSKVKTEKLEKQVRDKDASLVMVNAKLRESEERYEQLEAQLKRFRLQEQQYLDEIQGMRAARKDIDRDMERLQQKLLAQQTEFNSASEARDAEVDELRGRILTMEAMARADAEAAAFAAGSGTNGAGSDVTSNDDAASGSATPSKLSKDDWVASKGVKACQHCDVKFTMTNRKHHCRWCGKVFCGQCCAASPLTGGDRVCVDCNKAK